MSPHLFQKAYQNARDKPVLPFDKSEIKNLIQKLNCEMFLFIVLKMAV